MTKVTASQWHAGALLWLLLAIPGGLVVLVGSSRAYEHRQVDYLSRSPGAAAVVTTLSTALLGLLSLRFVAA
jgi:hypothetical protein